MSNRASESGPVKDPVEELCIRLGQLAVDGMDNAELDAGFALAMGYSARLVPGLEHGMQKAEVMAEGQWLPFSPTSDWRDFGHAVSNFAVVLGTHALYEGEEPDEVTGHRYSAHAYLSGTSFDSWDDIRIAAAKAAVAYGRNLGWKMAGTRKSFSGHGLTSRTAEETTSTGPALA